MKRISKVIICMAVFGSLLAGNMQTGISLSYNNSNYIPNDAQNTPIPGFRLGGLAQFPLGLTFVQCELLLSSKGFLAKSIGDTQLTNLFLYMELPFSLKYEFFLSDNWNIYLLGGVSARWKIIAINLVNELDGIRSIDAGLHAGLGLRYGKVAFEARFDKSIINFDLVDPGKYHQTLSLGMNFYFRGK